jgi:hypothetical protein
MLKLVFSYLLLLTITVLSAQDNDTGILYVGTFTSEGAEGIYQCSFNSSTGAISQTMVYKGVDNPNFLRKSPDGKYLYVVTRSPLLLIRQEVRLQLTGSVSGEISNSLTSNLHRVMVPVMWMYHPTGNGLQ